MMEKKIVTFQTRILLDNRVSLWHIGTYMALLHLFKQNSGRNPVRISRRKLMGLARIKSAPTYHKYLQDLVRFGYIHYEPTYHPQKGSQVLLLG